MLGKSFDLVISMYGVVWCGVVWCGVVMFVDREHMQWTSVGGTGGWESQLTVSRSVE